MTETSLTVPPSSGIPSVGDVTEDGAVICAQVFPNPEDHGFADDDLLFMQILRHPPVGPKGKFVQWVFETGIYDRGVISAEALETNTVTHSNDFEDLYALVQANAALATPGKMGGLHWLIGEQMLRDLIVSSYDNDDPVEAAEAAVFATSGTVTTFPRALTRAGR